MTPDQAADILIRLESGWSERWSATKVDLWLEQLQALDFTDTYDAVTELFRTSERPPTFAVVRAQVDMIQNRRQPTRTGRLCLRCRKEPAEPGRIRCGPCQAIVDDEVKHGVTSPALAAAIRAAHKSRSHECQPTSSTTATPSTSDGCSASPCVTTSHSDQYSTTPATTPTD